MPHARRRQLATLLKYGWAAPWTLLGLAIGLLARATRGYSLNRQGTISFWGGAATAFLRYFPLVRGASAMTLGHVILARSADDLEFAFDHEMVHVRQYERWGPLFVPAYLIASLWQLARGRHPYWDNPFEREAYGQDR